VSRSFAFAVCREGSEALLKGELARARPELKLAYSAPGLVTFKAPGELALDFDLGAVFARDFGISMGPLASEEAALDLARELGRERPVRLAVFPRGAELDDAGRAAMAALDRSLRASGLFGEGPAAAGDAVVDVAMDLGPEAVGGRPRKAPRDRRPWLGAHAHGPSHPSAPGGFLDVLLPAEAPSRAYLKLEQAVRRFDLPMRSGQRAIEIGSAPGGASYAMLKRGLAVIGIDPGEMDEPVLSHPRFEHRKVPVGAVKKGDLPRDVDWLVLDVNLAPPVALRYLDRVAGPLRDRLLGCVLTLKLNDPKLALEIPSYLARVEGMGFADVRATQLPANASEICVVGRGRRGASATSLRGST